MSYSVELLENFYRTMVRIRVCEESLVGPILTGEIRTPCHLYSGQEAVAAGICSSLNKDDCIFGNHRSHGHFLSKGGDMKKMVAEIFCRSDGCSQGLGGSMHLIDPEIGMMGSAPIVAGTISLAMGAALAASIKEDGQVAVSFFGDGATGEGVLYECLNFASLKKLPMVFVCENNFYATHMPIRECRVEKNIFRIAQPFGMESVQVDGNNVLEVYEVGRQAIENCRKGTGPSFIECLTYRQRGHVGPDDNVQGCHTDIRPEEEVENWLLRDPITTFEDYLISNNLVDEETLASIKQEVEEEVAEAHLFARKSPSPDPEDLMKFVFKTT